MNESLPKKSSNACHRIEKLLDGKLCAYEEAVVREMAETSYTRAKETLRTFLTEQRHEASQHESSNYLLHPGESGI